jgi:hypothetical protein
LHRQGPITDGGLLEIPSNASAQNGPEIVINNSVAYADQHDRNVLLVSKGEPRAVAASRAIDVMRSEDTTIMS